MVRGSALQRNSLAHSRHSNIYSLSGSWEKISESVESQINYHEAEGKADFCVSPNIGSFWDHSLSYSKWIQRGWDIP